MPLYEYQCEACGQRFEVIQKFSDAPAETCRVCGKGPVQRLISSPAIQFKGTGWYITDYSQKGKSSGTDSAPPASKSESKSSDSSGSSSDSGSSSSSSSTPASSPKTE
jgi:putative FmdB family regulatory protein